MLDGKEQQKDLNLEIQPKAVTSKARHKIIIEQGMWNSFKTEHNND